MKEGTSPKRSPFREQDELNEGLEELKEQDREDDAVVEEQLEEFWNSISNDGDDVGHFDYVLKLLEPLLVFLNEHEAWNKIPGVVRHLYRDAKVLSRLEHSEVDIDRAEVETQRRLAVELTFKNLERLYELTRVPPEVRGSPVIKSMGDFGQILRFPEEIIFSRLVKEDPLHIDKLVARVQNELKEDERGVRLLQLALPEEYDREVIAKAADQMLHQWPVPGERIHWQSLADVVRIKRATGIELPLDPEEAEEAREKILARFDSSQWKTYWPSGWFYLLAEPLEDLEELSHTPLNVEKHKDLINRIYEGVLQVAADEDSMLQIKEAKDLMLVLKGVVHVEPHFDPNKIQDLRQRVIDLEMQHIWDLPKAFRAAHERLSSIAEISGHPVVVLTPSERQRLTKPLFERMYSQNLERFREVKSYEEVFGGLQTAEEQRELTQGFYGYGLGRIVGSRNSILDKDLRSIEETLQALEAQLKISHRSFDPEIAKAQLFAVMSSRVDAMSVEDFRKVFAAVKEVAQTPLHFTEQQMKELAGLVVMNSIEQPRSIREKIRFLERETGIQSLPWEPEAIEQCRLAMVKAGIAAWKDVDIFNELFHTTLTCTEQEAQQMYDVVLELASRQQDFIGELGTHLEVLRVAIGHEPRFTPKKLAAICSDFCSKKNPRDFFTTIGSLKMMVKQELVFDPVDVHRLYERALSPSVDMVGGRPMGVSLYFRMVETATGIAPNVDSSQVQGAYQGLAKKIASNELEDACLDIFRATTIPPSSTTVHTMIAHMPEMNVGIAIIEIDRLASRFRIPFDPTQLAAGFRQGMVGHLKTMQEFFDIINQPGLSEDFRAKIQQAIEQDPWLTCIVKQSEQKHWSGVEWSRVHRVVQQSASGKGGVSLERAQDGEIFAAYLENIGYLGEHSIRLLAIYAECFRAKNFEHPPADVHDLVQRIYNEALVNDFSDENVRTADRIRRVFHSVLDVDNTMKRVRGLLIRHPSSISVLNRVLGASGSETEDDPLRAAYRSDPWVMAFSELERIQGVSANAENDPWAKELMPLLSNAASSELDLNNIEHVRLVVDYVKRFGMVNAPLTFSLFLDCHRVKTCAELSETNQQRLAEFGVKLFRPDGTERYPNPRLIINELQKSVTHVRSQLLNDEIPERLTTAIGQEQFQILIGRSRKTDQVTLASLVDTWRQTLIHHPEQGKPPSAMREVSFPVAILRARREEEQITEDERRVQLENLLTSKEVGERVLPLARALTSAERYANGQQWWVEKKAALREALTVEMQELERWLGATPELIDQWINEEQDDVARNKLIKKQKTLLNSKARPGVMKAYADLGVMSNQITATQLEEEGESAFVDLLTMLSKLDSKSSALNEAVMEGSAVHLLLTAPEGWKQRMHEAFEEGIAPTPERLSALTSFAREYLWEHYLNPAQVEEHIHHTPFDPELRKRLVQCWQQQLDHKGLLPLERSKMKLDAILHGKQEKSVKVVDTTMLPVAGLFRIFVGDIADGCHASQHQKLANGGLPNLHAWVYVTDPKEPQRATLCGSLVGIETTRSDNRTPTLVARANNPLENFIQQLAADQFVLASLKEVVATAKRMREERLTKNPDASVEQKRQSVAIPMDERGQASTNRTLVSQEYKKRWKNCEKIGLVQSPETKFNGYDIWIRNGSVGCVVIWEMDENGKETWFGDWGEK